MKRQVPFIVLFGMMQGLIFAQPSNYYHVRQNGSIHNAIIKNCSTHAVIIALSENQKEILPIGYHSCFEMEYPDYPEYNHLFSPEPDILEDEMIIGLGAAYVYYYWSPVVKSLSAREYSGSGSSVIMVSHSHPPGPPLKILSNKRIEVTQTSFYTGDNFRWLLITSDDTIPFTGNSFNQTAMAISNLIGFNKTFYIQPQTPCYIFDKDSNIIDTYRDTYEWTQDMLIFRVDSQFRQNTDCKNEFKIEFQTAHDIDLDVVAWQNGMNLSVPGHIGMSPKEGGWVRRTVLGSQLKMNPYFDENSPFSLTVMIHNTLSPYTSTANGLFLYPELSKLSFSCTPFCPDDPTQGRVLFTRDNTNYKEMLYFKQSDCLKPALIDTLVFEIGDASEEAINVPPGKYCYLQIRIMGDNGIQCQKSDTFSIKALKKPSLAFNGMLSPSCSGEDDGMLFLSAVDSNNTGQVHYYNLLADSEEINISQITSGKYEIVARDGNGCSSPPVIIEVPAVDTVEFNLSTIQPSCYGFHDGKILITDIRGGPEDASDTIYYLDDKIISLIDGYCMGDAFNGKDAYRVKMSVSRPGSPECFSEEQHVDSIGQPQRIILERNPDIQNVLCTGAYTGRISLKSNESTRKLTYHIFDTSGNEYSSASGNFQNLGANSYTGWAVFDENGCYSDTLEGILIDQPDKILLDSVYYKPESCEGTYDGIIRPSLYIDDKIYPTSVKWYSYPEGIFTGADQMEYSNATKGLYKIEVGYGPGDCSTFIDDVFRLIPPEKISVDLISVPTTCPGDSSGMLIISEIKNGTPGYRLSLKDDQSPMQITSGDTIRNLPAGLYSLHIFDNLFQEEGLFNTCKLDTTFTLHDKERIVLEEFRVHDPLCYGDSTASIDIIKITGPPDTNDFKFRWTKAGMVIAQTRNPDSLTSGQYELRIFDKQNCPSDVFRDFEINDPPELIIDTLILDSASCVEVTDGSVIVRASGGTVESCYYFSTGNDFLPNDSVFAGLKADTAYRISVMDEHGCIASETAILKAGEVTIQIADTSMVTCYGFGDGTIALTAGGGNRESFEYSLNSSLIHLNRNIPYFSNLDTGRYYCHVTDISTGCRSDSTPVFISQPDTLIVLASLFDSSACDKYLGKAILSIEGGNRDYDLMWHDHIGNIREELNLNALHAGIYKVSVVDRQGCHAEDTVWIPERSGPEIKSHIIMDSAWCGLPTGKIRLLTEHGSPAFHYHWSHIASADSNVASLLTAGRYYVTMSDRYDCTDEYFFDLADGPSIQAMPIIKDANCNMNNGRAEIDIRGGRPPYLFFWEDSLNIQPELGNSVEGLFAGNYSLLISDSIGCDTSLAVLIANLEGPKISPLKITSPWCGLNTGTAEVSITGGDQPYAIQWTAGSGSSQILSVSQFVDGLSEGSYIMKVVDSVGCIDNIMIALKDSVELKPDLICTSVDSAACGKPLGAITAEMYGGLAPYRYQWNTLPSDTLSRLTGILAGSYEVTATDQRGCSETLMIRIFDRRNPEIHLTGISDAYCGKPSGQFNIKLKNGKPPFYVFLHEDPNHTDYFLPGADSNSWQAIIDSIYPSGEVYHIQAADADGCLSNTLSDYINDVNSLQIDLMNIQPVKCYGGSDGSAAIMVEGGFEPYVFEWSMGDSGGTENHQLSAGLFNVTVTDSAGCEKISETWQVLQPSPVRITSTTLTNPFCTGLCDGRLTSHATGGTGLLKYIWNDTDTIQKLTGRCAGEHHLKVIDINGCSVTSTYMLSEPPMKGIPELPGKAEVCEGQEFIVNIGNSYSGCNWWSPNGFGSDSTRVVLKLAGDYFIDAVTNKGCMVKDTLTLVVSSNLLNADFLMASEGWVGDTIVVIDVSLPYAETCNWLLPDEAAVLVNRDHYKELVFSKPGPYYVELHASLATCAAMAGKNIEIFDIVPGKDAGQEAAGSFIRSMSIFPNPASEDLMLKVKLAEESAVRIEIVSLNGSYTMIYDGGQLMDAYEIEIDVSGLQPGIYLIRIIAGGETGTRMVVVR